MAENQPAEDPMLDLLMERVRNADTPEARQRAWDSLVLYQRQHGVRANPGNIESEKQ